MRTALRLMRKQLCVNGFCRAPRGGRGSRGGSVFFLQGVVAALARAHADDVFHVVDEDLAVADVPGIQGGARRFYYLFHGHLADDHFHLDFGQQVHIHLDAAVVLACALFHAAAEHLRHRDARHAQGVERGLQIVEFGLLGDDDDFGKFLFRPARADDGDHRVGQGLRGGSSRLGDLRRGSHIGIQHFRRQGDGRKVRVGAHEAVFVLVEPFDLLDPGSADAAGVFEELEEDDHAEDGPCGDADDAQKLYAEHIESAAVEQALLRRIAHGVDARREQPDGERAPQPVDAVHRDGAHGVVDVQLFIDDFDGDVDEDARDEPDEEGADDIDVRTARRHGNEPRQRAVERHGDIGLLVLDPGKDHRRDGARRRRDRGGDEDLRELRHARSRRAVEAVPAEPEDEHAERADGDVVPGDGADELRLFALQGGLAVLIEVLAPARP